MHVRLAFSPDSDDLFMFWPLLHAKVPTQGYSFDVVRVDTAALNQLASAGDADIVAISIAHYALVFDQYLLFSHGMSVGRGYGPVVVTAGDKKDRTLTLEGLRGKRVGVPGLSTTAYAILRAIAPPFEPVVVPIQPYRVVFDALRSHRIDAALLIHEGRLTYEREGFVKVVDLGEAWSELTTGLPLPLGGNAIRRSLGKEHITALSAVCKSSIAWALAHKKEVAEAILADPRDGLLLDAAVLDRYLAMYANDDTLTLRSDVRDAVDELLTRIGSRHAAEWA